MLDKTELQKRIDLCKNWLLDSGIQENNKNNPNFGGIYSWHDSDKNKYPFVYSEITGYGISCFLFLENFFKEDILTKKAENAANWLTKKALHENNYKCKYFLDEKKFLDHLCSFDGAMILAGLVSLFKKTENQEYKERAIALGDWLVDKMQKPDGSFYPKWDIETNQYIENDEKWSTQSGTFHAKHSISLLKLYEITKNKKYLHSAVKLCDWTVQQQKDNGRFPTNLKDDSTNQHPHCYTAEGLLYAGLSLNNNSYIESAKNAIKWSLASQLKNSGFPSIYQDEKFLEEERVDVLAQIIRLAILVGENDKIDSAVARLLKFQNLDENNNGGFAYSSDQSNHINSWVSMFALQALIFYHNKTEGKENSMDYFI